MRKSILIVLLLVVTGLTALQAQNSNVVQFDATKEAAFSIALRQYKSKDYHAAFVQFESLSNSTIIHQRMTGTLLMAGKSLYQLGRYIDAVPYFERLIQRFPESKYRDDAYLAKSQCNYQMNRNIEAMEDLIWIFDHSADDRLVKKSQAFSGMLIRKYLSAADLERLLRGANSETSAALLSIGVARKYLSTGNWRKAVRILTRYKQEHIKSAYTSQIDGLLIEAQNYDKKPVKVGVILPLTGYLAEEGLGIFRGIKFAHSQSQKSANQAVQLVVRDSEGSLIKAIHGMDNLIKRENVQVIIGDLYSDVTAGIGALAARDDVPLVGPAATENEVASVGESVYQLNSDLQRKGQAMAEYAYNELGLRTFAILSPGDDEYGQQMTSSFASTVDKLGGRIIKQTWYFGVPQDVGNQFKSIRTAAFDYDSTDVEEMILAAKRRGQKLEERHIPVLSVDGIFLPIFPDHIAYVAPQLALHNIRAQILGGEYWDDLEILQTELISQYVNGVIFGSDYFPDEESRTFRSFRNEFRLQMKTTPERWEVFGYDAFNIINQAIQGGAKTKKDINRSLRTLHDYEGMKGKISFLGNARVNREVNFLQFLNGRIVKHQTGS